MNAWSRFWFEPGPAATLGFCRAVFFSGVFLWQIQLDYGAWGAYPDVLWMPIWLFDRFNMPLLPPGAIDVVQVVWKAALLASALGLLTRLSTGVAFVLGVYLLGLPHNFGQTQHFDTLAVFVMGALALSRAGDAWSIDALRRAARERDAALPPPSGEYTWPIRFVWVATALIFFAAGVSKLRASGLEWAFSDNLAMLLRRQQFNISDGEPWTAWGPVVAQYPWVSRGMAASALAIETLFPLALFSRTARVILVPAAFGFLVGIRALMGPTFEQFMVCFVFWIPWSEWTAVVRSRIGRPRSLRTVLYDGSCGLCTRSVAVLSRLDLLRRLEFAAVTSERGRVASRYPALDLDACVTEMHALDQHGRLTRGFDAYRSMMWVLPAGWLLLPVLWLPGVPTAGRRLYRAVASRRHTGACAAPLMPSPGATHATRAE